MKSVARVAAAALVMGGALWVMVALLEGVSSYILLGAGLLLGGSVFWAASFALGVKESRDLPRMVLGRLRR